MLLRFFVCISAAVVSVGGTSRNSQNSSSPALEAKNSSSNAMINF